MNPFKPTAGKMPPILIGRQNVVDDFVEGLENGAGAPGRLMLITGQRGFGKTVLLTQLRREAAARGWDVLSETASPGMVERLTVALQTTKPRLSHVDIAPAISIPGLANAQLGKVSIDKPQAALTLRNAIAARLRKLPSGKGILFTVDEAQAASVDEMVAIATAVQHVITDEDLSDDVPDAEKRGIAFVFAALPSVADDLEDHRVLTFLRRALRHDLGPIPLPDVRNALRETVSTSGKAISLDDAQFAADETGGNPYMVQLVGYYAWQAACARQSDTIEREDVALGAHDAQGQFLQAVCAPAFRTLTSAQQHFLQAMTPDWPDASALGDIAERAGKSMSWVGKYRTSLEKAQVIRTSDWGQVEFAIPHFGEWLTRQQR